jgi:hypothetical protein
MEREFVFIAAPPAALTSSVATFGFALWVRYRYGYVPRMRHISAQFMLSFVASMGIGYQWLLARRRTRDALGRMMRATQGTIEIRASESGATRIPIHEFDAATGVNAEEESRKLLDRSSYSSSNNSVR